MATSLLKITQNLNTDIAGNALIGDTVDPVIFTNGDDTGVTSWEFRLVYTPPGSAIAPFTQGPGLATSFNIGTPDIPGCYRVMLITRDALGNQDVDIRNFAVPTATRNWLIPPFQGNPLPLPLTGQNSKPDELNFGGQVLGWAGDDNASRQLLHQILLDIEANL